MEFYAGTVANKVDAKGRVSIPAPFRKVLDREREPHVCVTPHPGGEASLICSGVSRLERMREGLKGQPVFSKERAALEHLIFSSTEQLLPDGTGRIVLPAEMRALIGVTDEALFVGRGDKFLIVQPEAYRAEEAALKAMAREALETLVIEGL